MTKEDLLNEMYALLRKFDSDMLQLMNMIRHNGELNDEIDISTNKSQNLVSERGTLTSNVDNISEKKPLTLNIGDIIEGKIDRIIRFGAFVQVQQDPLVGFIHISRLASQQVNSVDRS